VAQVRACGPECRQGVGRKISRGPTEKIPKNSKKDRKIALFKPLPGGGVGNGKKYRKIAKKHQKIALFSLYLLYLYHV